MDHKPPQNTNKTHQQCIKISTNNISIHLLKLVYKGSLNPIRFFN